MSSLDGQVFSPLDAGAGTPSTQISRRRIALRSATGAHNPYEDALDMATLVDHRLRQRHDQARRHRSRAGRTRCLPSVALLQGGRDVVGCADLPAALTGHRDAAVSGGQEPHRSERDAVSVA
ncbi:hypothetical protein GCM10010140_55650 [Streptosporangium pseudovulgare]|uniref:Uncharacterized protein n=1 Tax=Streptosporangium pseudovulgare TaxID=35765 RepID=A0ABQ2R7T2_9ACTN|nr:hypothetical protein GCM10010140_55650 [Streptosporangium pseudovulgare]